MIDLTGNTAIGHHERHMIRQHLNGVENALSVSDLDSAKVIAEDAVTCAKQLVEQLNEASQNRYLTLLGREDIRHGGICQLDDGRRIRLLDVRGRRATVETERGSWYDVRLEDVLPLDNQSSNAG